MGKFTDAEGNEVEAFTAEEVTVKQAEAVKAAEDAAAAKKEEDDKKAAEDKAAEDARIAAAAEGEPDAVTVLTGKLEGLTKTMSESRKGEVLSKFKFEDAEVKASVAAKFDQLAAAGYEDTAEGFAQRAVDAYTIIVGSSPTAGMDVSGFAGGPARDQQEVKKDGFSAKDIEIQTSLGITQEMRDKHSPTKK